LGRGILRQIAHDAKIGKDESLKVLDQVYPENADESSSFAFYRTIQAEGISLAIFARASDRTEGRRC